MYNKNIGEYFKEFINCYWPTEVINKENLQDLMSVGKFDLCYLDNNMDLKRPDNEQLMDDILEVLNYILTPEEKSNVNIAFKTYNGVEKMYVYFYYYSNFYGWEELSKDEYCRRENIPNQLILF